MDIDKPSLLSTPWTSAPCWFKPVSRGLQLRLVCVELMSTEVCGIVDGNQMCIKLCVVFLLF